MGNLKINKKLLPIKAHYFLFNAGTAPLMPYIPTYARQLGVPSTGVGIMYAILPFVGLVSKPTFGALADKFKIGKFIFISAIICTAIFFGSIAFIPPKTTEPFMELGCDGTAYLKTCNISDDCSLKNIELEFLDKDIMECQLVCTDPDELFLDLMCNEWNISETCSQNLSSIEMTTYSNISYTSFEQSCLIFPISSIQLNESNTENLQCNQKNIPPLTCSVMCNSSTIMGYIQNTIIEQMNEPYYSTIQFQLLFLFMALQWAAQAVVVSLSDSICFKLLGDKPHNYGVQRLWGAVGWGMMAVIAGYLIDLASVGDLEKDYTPSFYLVVIILSINALSVTKIKVYHQEPYEFRKVVVLFRKPRIVLFLFSCITFGILIGTVWQFHLWFLEDLAKAQGCDSLQWIKLLQGIAMGVQCFAGEAPFLFLSGWFIRKLGHVHTITLILLVMGVRLLAYSYLVNPWYTLPIDLLNGLTLGLYWSTMASYANFAAPLEAPSTLQGIFGALFEGIGTSIGSLTGGIVYDKYGGATMFRSFGIYGLIYGALYSLLHIAMDYSSSSRRKHSMDGIEHEISDEDISSDGKHISSYGSLKTGYTHSHLSSSPLL